MKDTVCLFNLSLNLITFWALRSYTKMLNVFLNVFLHRTYGHKMLQGLAVQKEFLDLWTKIIPVKDRRPLEKILSKMRR